MDDCRGFGNWLACLKCIDICTSKCPFEREDVFEEFKIMIRTQEEHGSMKIEERQF